MFLQPDTAFRERIERDPGLLTENEMLEVIVKYNGNIFNVQSALGAPVEILDSDYALVTIRLDQLDQLYGIREVEYIELPKNLFYSLRESMTKGCISSVQAETELALTGEGTIIGIIDSGIDYTHPDFRNEDGTSRIISVWDQAGNGNPPQGFTSGIEYTNADLNRALTSPTPFSVVPELDIVGHGTAVAGIAAGNGRASRGAEVGAAPKAFLIVVKLKASISEFATRSTDIMRGIKYISDIAEALSMPVSINLSYGTNNGAHDGNSLFETYIDSMAQKWKTVICVASGNEGSAGHHFSGQAVQGQSLDVEFVVSGTVAELYMSLWKNFADTLHFELFSPSGRSSGILRPEDRTRNITLDNTQIFSFYGQPTHYTSAQEVYFLLKGLSGPVAQGLWRLRVTGIQVVDGRFDIWLPTVEEVTAQTSFSQPSPETTLTLPSTSASVITVGGYNASISISAGFSGRGYTRLDVFIKPDLVAPAVNILSTRAGGGYDSFSGTSVAAPFVTGSAALMMEWGIVKGNDPFLYGQRAKAFLQKGARRDFSIPYPNPIWGYGTLCLKNTMDYLIQYII